VSRYSPDASQRCEKAGADSLPVGCRTGKLWARGRQPVEGEAAVIAVRKSDGCMGAEISGVDLSRPLPDRIFGAVRAALHRHQVLVFRGQSLEPENFPAFANRFGRSEPHVLDQFHHPEYTDIPVLSNVKKNGEPTGLADGGTYWHSVFLPADSRTRYAAVFDPGTEGRRRHAVRGPRAGLRRPAGSDEKSA
jgi:TfdA family taurine catabolism dioxygenase TauD